MQSPSSYSDGLVTSESCHLLVAAALALGGFSQSSTASLATREQQREPAGQPREQNPGEINAAYTAASGARGEHTARRKGKACEQGHPALFLPLFSRFQFPRKTLLVTFRAELKPYTRLDVVFPLVSSRGK